MAERCAALDAARERLDGYLTRETGREDGVPALLREIQDRAVLAAALEGGFEEAWAVVTRFPSG